MTNHTPGPWRTGDRFNTVFGPPNGNPAPEIIATVHKGNEANARLLARAPELLAENQRLKELGESALRAANAENARLREALKDAILAVEQLDKYLPSTANFEMLSRFRAALAVERSA